jgi:hypothetical protein
MFSLIANTFIACSWTDDDLELDSVPLPEDVQDILDGE